MRIDARLDVYKPMSTTARGALLSSLLPSRDFKRGSDIQQDGQSASAAYVIVEGLALSHRCLQDGARQIIALHFAGDLVGLSAVVCGHQSQGLAALTSVKAAEIPKDALLKLIESNAELAYLLTRDMARDARIAQEWLVGLGRRSAYVRAAHLICEIVSRYVEIDPAVCDRYPFPLTQAELADALGLSIVHVNRVLQRLRGEGLIELASNALTILNWSALRKTAGFDPSYLAPFVRAGAESPLMEPAR